MLGRDREDGESAEYKSVHSESLKDAMRLARIQSATRSSVVVDLRDAEQARLEMLNEALDPLFAEIPAGVEMFDRGISTGDTPRLWIDVVAHVVMGRDKRLYRFVLDGRNGRKTLAESTEIDEMVAAITHYIANRLVERERALTDNSDPLPPRMEFIRRTVRADEHADRRSNAGSDDRADDRPVESSEERSGLRWRMTQMFVFGLIVGCLALFTALWIVASRPS